MKSIITTIFTLVMLILGGQTYANTSDDEQENFCKPEGGASCTGAGINSALAKAERRINLNYKKLLLILPKENPNYTVNLPSPEKFKKVHVAWKKYVTEYCEAYWDIYDGAPTWKSTQSR